MEALAFGMRVVKLSARLSGRLLQKTLTLNPNPYLQVEDPLVHGGARVRHQGGEVIRQVVGAAADHLEQGLCLAHLSVDVARQRCRHRFTGPACTQQWHDAEAVQINNLTHSIYM